MRDVIIIAEAGVNHNGNIELARKLIDIASEAGVDYVKFQTFKAENLVSKDAKMADYQKNNIGTTAGDSQYQMLKKLELSYDDFRDLKKYCEIKKVKFLSTAFDLESIDFLYELGIDLFKIPSGEITNYPYLVKIGKFNTNVVLSTGMCNMSEISEAVDVLVKSGTNRQNITILHCTTDYPTKMEDVNLNAMLEIKKVFNLPIGYSDHTLGIDVPIAAVAMGAEVIEKHFTIDKKMNGPDHKASLNGNELKQMVLSIRNVSNSLGSSNKQPTKTEIENILVARKSIHLAKDLEVGQEIKEDDLVMKRPGNGISPMKMDSIIGKKAKVKLSKDSLLNYEDLV